MRWFGSIEWDVADTAEGHYFRLNHLSDPGAGESAVKFNAFDNFAALYKNYVVLRGKVTTWLDAPTQDTGTFYYSRFANNDTAEITFPFGSQDKVKTRLFRKVSAASTQLVAPIVETFECSRLANGATVMDASNEYAYINSVTPSKYLQYNVVLESQDHATNLGADGVSQHLIEVEVVWWDPISINDTA
jgi:hypothetical protein